MLTRDEDAKNIIYKIEIPSLGDLSKADPKSQMKKPRVMTSGQDDLFVSIEVQCMDYFSEPVKAIYLRDVTKLVSNHVLKCRNSQGLSKIQNIKYSNENVAHEMRAPLSSIIILIGILLSLGQSARDKKRAREHCRQIRIQAELLLHFVNDMLDFSNIAH